MVLDAYDTVGRVRLGTGAQQPDDDGTCWGICSLKRHYLTLGTSPGRMDVEEYICPRVSNTIP